MFFFGDKKARAKRRKKKKLRRRQKEEFFRRTHIIIEARKKHLKNRKKAGEGLLVGGFGWSSDNEEKDIEPGKAIEKLKRRQKSLAKSRNTHLAKLQAARSKMVARART